jgi:hypothetical protein
MSRAWSVLLVALAVAGAACGTSGGGTDPGSQDAAVEPGPGDEGAADEATLPPDATPDPAGDEASPDEAPEALPEVAEESQDAPEVEPEVAEEAAEEIAEVVEEAAQDVPPDPEPDADADPAPDLPPEDVPADVGPQDPGEDAAPDGPAEVAADLPPEETVCLPVAPTAQPWQVTFADDGVTFQGMDLPKSVPAMRLFASFTGIEDDASVCGTVTWKLGNRVVLKGVTPDGAARGRLSGAELYYDVDQLAEDDLYPTIDGGKRPYPFAIELLDDAGTVLWRGRLREPLQVREYMLAVFTDQGFTPTPAVLDLVQAWVQADLEAFTFLVPELPGAVAIRFLRDLSPTEKADLAGITCGLDTTKPLALPIDLPSGTVAKASLCDLPDVPLSMFDEFSAEAEVKLLHGSADPADSVTVAILGDGFTAAQKADFTTRAAEVADFLVALEPLATWAPRVNVFSIWTPSASSGASYDCACSTWDTASNNCAIPADGCVDALRDTVFGSVYTVRALYKLMFSANPPGLQMDRNLFARYLFRIGMAMSLSAPDGTPVNADAAIVLVNDGKKGAFGLYNATVATAYEADGAGNLAEVATHELGHAFGLLGDEYQTSSDVCQSFDLTPLFPNFSPLPLAAADVPWEAWLTLSAPFPNTEDQGAAGDVGCFVPGPGGGQCHDDVGGDILCRPAKTCKMKTNSGAFCPVCREHVTRRILRQVDFIRAERPDITRPSALTYVLDADLSDTAVTTTWSVDGVVKATTAAWQPYTLDASSLSTGPHTVKVVVKKETDDVRIWTGDLVEEMTFSLTRE